MLPWSLKHRIFAYDTYVKNGESRVCGEGVMCVEISETTRLCCETPYTWRIEDCNTWKYPRIRWRNFSESGS